MTRSIYMLNDIGVTVDEVVVTAARKIGFYFEPSSLPSGNLLPFLKPLLLTKEVSRLKNLKQQMGC